MGDTALMDGLRKATIGTPAIAHQKSVKIRTQHRSGLVKASAPMNRIDSDAPADEDPCPMEFPAHLPPGFIGGDTGFGTYPVQQYLIAGFSLARHTGDGLAQTASTYRQPERLLKHSRRLPVGQS